MRTKLSLTIVFLWIFSFCHAQQNSDWKKWHWLMGEWKGEGTGQPGQGGGTFSFAFNLEKKLLKERVIPSTVQRNNFQLFMMI